ncbi:MAG: hypothetical protein U1E65_31705 [Myxococcota bacterium]
MNRGAIGGALLVLAGLVALVIVGKNTFQGPTSKAEGSGDVGFVTVYAQLARGPVRLEPKQDRVVPRPQDLAFQWTAEGTGPRNIHIEVRTVGPEPEVLAAHDERVFAPMKLDSLGWVVHLGDAQPDHLEVVVTISAPHTASRTIRYPFTLGAHDPADGADPSVVPGSK